MISMYLSGISWLFDIASYFSVVCAILAMFFTRYLTVNQNKKCISFGPRSSLSALLKFDLTLSKPLPFSVLKITSSLIVRLER